MDGGGCHAWRSLPSAPYVSMTIGRPAKPLGKLQRDCPLHVVLYSEATERIPAGGGAPTGQASMTSHTDEIPPPPVKLSYHEPTCFYGSKAFVVAWAPAPSE